MKQALTRYLAHPDERVATGNLIAFLLGSHAPFYPLYVLWAAGLEGWPWGMLTVCSTPFFLAVPLLARRHPLAGRVLLEASSLGNTVFCTWVLGEPSGTELFLMPCAMLPGLVFRRSEWPLLLSFIAAPFALYFVLRGDYPPPPQVWTQAASSGLFTLSAASAGCVLAAFAWLVASPASAREQAEQPRAHQHAER